ncbi:MAG: hypothetical protein KME46_33075 [Brasilonema angustatum HA4187-MV1]|jgi:hypothetical protein|nr:hypothetical protein [Brasilonema angustatum HA4187-MV1]
MAEMKVFRRVVFWVRSLFIKGSGRFSWVHGRTQRTHKPSPPKMNVFKVGFILVYQGLKSVPCGFVGLDYSISPSSNSDGFVQN